MIRWHPANVYLKHSTLREVTGPWKSFAAQSVLRKGLQDHRAVQIFEARKGGLIERRKAAGFVTKIGTRYTTTEHMHQNVISFQ